MDSSIGSEQTLQSKMALVDLKKSVEILKSENVLGIPTETVYGLAARIDSKTALQKIFTTKKRPFFDPLIVHLAASFNPKDYTLTWFPLYEALTEKFWPGPLTLIAPRNEKISYLITAGLPDVGLRSPDHPLTQKLIEELEVPVAAPSANMFGKTSPTTAQHVEEEFSGKIAVLDGGPSQVGVESTVIRYEETEKTLYLLRPGFISQKQLAEVAQRFSVKVCRGTSQAAPGQLKAHYQPRSPLVLEYTDEENLTSAHQEQLENQLGKKNLHWRTLHLSSSAELTARTLYGQFRELSQGDQTAIWVPYPPTLKDQDEWAAILDRLQRAARLILP